MGMAGVSSLLRHCGAFFLRRTFGSDHLYKATFSEYVKMLLCSRESPMEFFVEGTRSRSGKSLHPRLGKRMDEGIFSFFLFFFESCGLCS